jgi:hypothetical protein
MIKIDILVQNFIYVITLQLNFKTVLEKKKYFDF